MTDNDRIEIADVLPHEDDNDPDERYPFHSVDATTGETRVGYLTKREGRELDERRVARQAEQKAEKKRQQESIRGKFQQVNDLKSLDDVKAWLLSFVRKSIASELMITEEQLDAFLSEE